MQMKLYFKEDKKFRLQKNEKKILKSDQKFEIRKVLLSKEGNFLVTCGIIQDTKIHVYNGVTLSKLKVIDINKVINDKNRLKIGI